MLIHFWNSGSRLRLKYIQTHRARGEYESPPHNFRVESMEISFWIAKTKIMFIWRYRVLWHWMSLCAIYFKVKIIKRPNFKYKYVSRQLLSVLIKLHENGYKLMRTSRWNLISQHSRMAHELDITENTGGTVVEMMTFCNSVDRNECHIRNQYYKRTITTSGCHSPESSKFVINK